MDFLTSKTLEPSYTCPNCNHEFVPTIIVLDGGSKNCPKCQQISHLCCNGKYKIGSPGPQLCMACKNEKSKQDVKMTLTLGFRLSGKDGKIIDVGEFKNKIEEMINDMIITKIDNELKNNNRELIPDVYVKEYAFIS